jgi:2'-5' RNA ligase
VAESALIVRVPEAERHVASFRERFDPSAKLGVPAHVTLLFPFVDPGSITEAVIEQVRSVALASPAFEFRLTAIRRFPRAVYLAPEPAELFLALTGQLMRAFPGLPPYAGEHADIVPHLTVAQIEGPRQDAVEAELRGALRLPIRAACAELTLIESSSGRWRTLHSFALTDAGPGT